MPYDIIRSLVGLGFVPLKASYQIDSHRTNRFLTFFSWKNSHSAPESTDVGLSFGLKMSATSDIKDDPVYVGDSAPVTEDNLELLADGEKGSIFFASA
jgi:hypothetical protein